MDTNDDKDPYDHLKMLDLVSRGQTALYIEHSERIVSQEKERTKKAIEIVLSVGRILCPDKLEEMQQQNPIKPLNEMPLEEIAMAIIHSANLLKIAAACSKLDGKSELEKLAEKFQDAQNQIKMERHRANEFQAKYERTLEEIRNLRRRTSNVR